MKLKKESIGYVVSFTFVVCMAFVLILAVANKLTLSRVEANRQYASHYTVLKALGLADAGTSREAVETSYAEKVKALAPPASGGLAYSAEIDGLTYLAVQVTNPGLWGPITAILAADPAAERVRGLEILDQQETPGLGGRIGEPWFAAQFSGEKVDPEGRISVVQGSGKGDPDKENSKVDAITGASRTSDFMQTLIAIALEKIREIGGTL